MNEEQTKLNIIDLVERVKALENKISSIEAMLGGGMERCQTSTKYYTGDEPSAPGNSLIRSIDLKEKISKKIHHIEHMISRGQVAKKFNVCSRTIKRWEESFGLKAHKINTRMVMYRVSEVIECFEKQNQH